jgi:ParB family chromosome partitioning protein
MKAADRLSQQLGAHINESMGAGGSGPAVHGGPYPPPAAVHGGPDKYRGAARVKDALAIEVGRLAPDPDQPRKDFDPAALEDLAASLKARGQLQPIRVRWAPEADAYVIVLGERRWRAAGIAGLETMACVVIDGPASPEDLLEDQLVENALRVDLRPIEQARSYQALMAARGLSQRALAERLHVSPASVAKAVALLTLPEPIQQEVDSGAIGPDVAYQLSKVDDVREQAELAGRAVAGSIRRDELKERARSPRQRRGAKGKSRKITERVIRIEGGPRVTVESRRGLDGPAILAALELATALVKAELDADQVAA